MWEDLIDTLWNVKFFFSKTNRKLPPDLIDTLWNVKVLVDTGDATRQFGFNRYIVECKESFTEHGFVMGLLDLIDTLWNVKALCLCL